jgi:hypothetical protein
MRGSRRDQELVGSALYAMRIPSGVMLEQLLC